MMFKESRYFPPQANVRGLPTTGGYEPAATLISNQELFQVRHGLEALGYYTMARTLTGEDDMLPGKVIHSDKDESELKNSQRLIVGETAVQLRSFAETIGVGVEKVTVMAECPPAKSKLIPENYLSHDPFAESVPVPPVGIPIEHTQGIRMNFADLD